MFCKKCSKETEENAPFCVHCGTRYTPATPTQVKNSTSFFHSFFGCSKFHIITLFYLVSVCASVCATLVNTSFPLPIIEALLIFALFKLKALAKQGAPLSKFVSPIKIFRVLINLYRFLAWLPIALIGFLGFVMLFAGSALAGGGMAEFAESAFNKFSTLSFLEPIASLFGGITLTFLSIIFIVMAIFQAVLIIFMYGSFYKTVRSAELSAKEGTVYILSVNSTKIWLIVAAVLKAANVIFSLGSDLTALLNIVSVGFYVAALLLAAKTLKNIKKV